MRTRKEIEDESNTFGIYAQDDIGVNSKLILEVLLDIRQMKMIEHKYYKNVL